MGIADTRINNGSGPVYAGIRQEEPWAVQAASGFKDHLSTDERSGSDLMALVNRILEQQGNRRGKLPGTEIAYIHVDYTPEEGIALILKDKLTGEEIILFSARQSVTTDSGNG